MLNLSGESKAMVGDHASATVMRKGKIIGFTESGGRGRAAHGDIGTNGEVKLGISGKPAEGEQDTIDVCQRFVQHLNKKERKWCNPILTNDEYLDAIAEPCSPEQSSKLKIQVVRAFSDRSAWKELAQNNVLTIEKKDATEASGLMMKSILLKKKKIPEKMRAGIDIVLNSIDTPALCFDAVIDAFREEHYSLCKTIGFNSVWIIGPSLSMVKQLYPST